MKRKSCETYWGDDACVVWGHSPVDSLIVINLAAEKSFTSVNMLIHTGERPFSCSVCNYQRRQDCDLKQHMRRHKYTPQKIAKKILPNFVVIVAKFCDTKLPKFAKIFWYVSAFRYVLYCRFSWFVQWFYMAQKLQTPKSQLHEALPQISLGTMPTHNSDVRSADASAHWRRSYLPYLMNILFLDYDTLVFRKYDLFQYF